MRRDGPDLSQNGPLGGTFGWETAMKPLQIGGRALKLLAVG